MYVRSSGIPALDEALGGLMVGDNVVWAGGSAPLHDVLHRAFLDPAMPGPATYVTLGDPPARVRSRYGAHVRVVDARTGRPHSDLVALERAILDAATPDGRLVVADLDEIVARVGVDRAVGFFSRVCPQLFDVGAVAYWRAGSRLRPALERVRRVTQCVLDVDGEHLRVVRAEGRRGVQGRMFRLALDGDVLTVEPEAALGRLAQGLRAVRASRRLAQSDLARMAGVSPSAISQAEAGHRGLALDTVLTLAGALGIGVDQLLAQPADAGYVIARRDRTAPRRGMTALVDDPAVGLRAYLVHLGPGEVGEPPVTHKGVELVVVAAGLVQLDMGHDAAVVRAGDAVLATTTAIREWRNLVPAPAQLFWILRDPGSSPAP
ncbi:MAG TPA: XRE family transcriptional regulator [Frankiaceae bacterium]|nr:XRE family transcriptional regulator [Frankiaceae bacterium]